MNLTEILVANGAGVAMVVLLYLSRVKFHETKSIGERLFDNMLLVTLVANLAEIVSFLIDGKDFPFSRPLLLFINALCIGATALVGFQWCLYTDFRIHRRRRRLNKTAALLCAPCIAVLVLLVADLAGAGLFFEITPENVYNRGPLSLLVYLLLLGYFVYSVAETYRFRKRLPHVRFFPVLYFIVPCMLGILIQGLFYGVTVGWMTVAMALAFVQLNLQSENAFIDEMSGLYNRNYLNHILDFLQRRNDGHLYGIMLDVDNFKQINDTCGHLAGDDAIRAIGVILLESAPEGSVALRMGGDEFIMLLPGNGPEDAEATLRRIREGEAALNARGGKPYALSLSIGCARYDGDTDAFLAAMDQAMYECKES